MPLNYPRISDEIKKMDLPELIEVMANRGHDETMAIHARHVYEENQRTEQRKYASGQMQEQHKLNKDNIELQHAHNLEIFKKQKRLTFWTTGMMAVATVAAALAGAYLAYALLQIPQKIQTQTDTATQILLQATATTSHPVVKYKREKVPSSAPTKTTLDPNEKGPEGRLEPRP